MTFTKPRFIKLITCVGMLLTCSAQAAFYIDYQGLDYKKPPKAESVGVLHQLGDGKATTVNSFGKDMSLKDTISMIVPTGWITYIDADVSLSKNINWQAQGETWTQVLERLGLDQGYRFIIDWEQKLLQVASAKSFLVPDYTAPVTVTLNKKSIFVYSNKPISSKAVFLSDGKRLTAKNVNKKS